MTAISAPFFLLWWGLQRRRYECLALAHGFLSELIIEALIDSSSADEKSRYELAKLYIRHWMDKTPLEVMLTKGKNTEESASTSIVMEKILSALRNLAGRGGGGSDSPS